MRSRVNTVVYYLARRAKSTVFRRVTAIRPVKPYVCPKVCSHRRPAETRAVWDETFMLCVCVFLFLTCDWKTWHFRICAGQKTKQTRGALLTPRLNLSCFVYWRPAENTRVVVCRRGFVKRIGGPSVWAGWAAYQNVCFMLIKRVK